MTTGSLVDQAQQLLQSLVGGDLVEITLLSLAVSGLATALSLLIGLPIGTWLALSRFRSRGLVISVVNTGMALPPGGRRDRTSTARWPDVSR